MNEELEKLEEVIGLEMIKLNFLENMFEDIVFSTSDYIRDKNKNIFFRSTFKKI